MVMWLPKFLASKGYHFFLPMVLHCKCFAHCTRAPLLFLYQTVKLPCSSESAAATSKISWLKGSSFAPASARGGEEDDVAGPSPGRNLLLIFKSRPMTLKIYIIRSSKMEFFYTYWKRLQSTKEKEEPNNCKSYHQLNCLVFAIFRFT